MSIADTDFEPVIDARQRAMLEAMGITVWQPEASSHAAAAAHENFKPNQPLPVIERAQIATDLIAPGRPPEVIAAVKPVAAPLIQRSPSAQALMPRPAGIEQMDWSALQTAVSSCQACALCESRKNTVFGVGQLPADASQAPQVDWLIVGEAPGEHEDLQGEPFVGQAGKLLDNMLAAMRIGMDESGKPSGLSRSKGVYIANVLKCRPPANRNPSAEEVAMCEPYLARQIELLRPKIILAMGKYAIQSMTGSNEPVGKLRGRVHTLKHATYQAPVIVTYHPAYLLRNLPEKAKAWADLLLAMETYRQPSKA
jgi:uracil-DNA glycosylase